MKVPGAVRGAGRVTRRFFWPLLFAVTVCAVLFLGVLPTRAYVAKRQDISAAESELAHRTEQNDLSQAHVDALKTDAEVERIAREQYGLVRPGEEAYHVLPPPQEPARLPDVWPFDRLHHTGD